MTTANTPTDTTARQASIREREALLAALATELLNDSGRDSTHVVNNGTTVLICRSRAPVLLEQWPAHYTPERIAELERRAATLDDSELLCEIKVSRDSE